MDILHYRKENTRFGDTFPLWADGVYHLYYLRYDEEIKTQVWAHLSSRDLICWEEQPNLLEPLGKGSEETSLLTGCVYYEDGVYHAFYPARSSDRRCHIKKAISSDGISFCRQGRELFEIDPRYSDDGTWRDPCVVKDAESGEYHMYFCAKRPIVEGDAFPGVLAHATSKDLENWTLEDSAWGGGAGTTVECPDLIKLDGRDVLVYYWHDTRVRVFDGKSYRRVRTLSPAGFDFMAGKTLTANGRVLLFGWIPEKTCDCCERIWGGNLAIPRELYLEDGEPCCRFMDEIYSLFDRDCSRLSAEKFSFVRGDWTRDGNTLRADAEREGAIAYLTEAEDDYYFSTNLTVEDDCGEIGFLFRTNRDESRKYSAENDLGYIVSLDLSENRLSLREHYLWDQRPELAGASLRLEKGKSFFFEMIVHKDIVEIGLDRKKTLSFRMKKHTSAGAFSIYAQDCRVTFGDLTAKTKG